MVDETDTTEADGQPQEPEVAVDTTPAWSQVWHLPMLILGMVLLGVGLYQVIPEAESDQYTDVLDEVAQYLKANNLDEAQTRLKVGLEPFIAGASPQERARYQMLWGDLIYQQQAHHGWDKRENHARVRDYYLKAREMGQTMDGPHLQRLAETYVALGNEVKADEVIDELREFEPRRRYGVIKKIIERRRQAGAGVAELTPLMLRYEQEVRAERDRAARVAGLRWAVVLHTRGLLESGQPHQAIQYLQRRMIYLMDEGGDAAMAPLRVMLAKAYQRLGEYPEAQRWYQLAQQSLEPTDPLNADILVGQAQIELAETGNLQVALEGFTAAVKDFPTSQVYFNALVGRADCEAKLDAHAEALQHLGEAVERFNVDRRRNPEKLDLLATTIGSHYEKETAREDYERALAYLTLLKPVYRADLPAEVLLEFARTHQRTANQRLAEAAGDDADTLPDRLPAADDEAGRALNQEAAVHYGIAGDYFMQYARAIGPTDEEAYANSLWDSAMSYDMAQAWDEAIAGYDEFVRTRAGDPRQLEATRRLALAYQSGNNHQAAVDLLRGLVDDNGESPEALASLVPLARSHEALGDMDAAERILQHVLTDHRAITPDSPPYREGLIALAKLHHRQGRFEDAITRFTEAVDRFGGDPDGVMLRFDLADAYRQSVSALDESLTKPMPQSKQMALMAERARRLEAAQGLFDRVTEELDRPDAPDGPAIQRVALRNAYFYRADCAYDLGRFDEAIGLYDQAAKRWETHPASLVALVQIVNAYCEMGQIQQAKVANDRARWQLKRIPDEAFEDPSRLPMTREHWEDWLRWSSELNLFGSQANATAGFSGAGTP